MVPSDDESTLDVELSQDSRRNPSGEKSDTLLGRRIGPYRVESLIAHGGMGRVYLATREDDYKQQVALKLIDRQAGSLDLVDRFFRERQILARLQHPGIARILDGGTTYEGLPYFAMEYVDGEPVDRFCARRNLDLRARLELIQRICGIVQYSHQNLVIHRDLKPHNILVTADGAPKLLDFGIAEFLHSKSDDRPARAHARALTPNYASPEQFRGEMVTTASDIYSLGVLLFCLTADRPPYDLRRLSLSQADKLLSSTPPSRPSEVAPPVVGRQLTGDVDAIVLKAMAPNPEDRYSSAAQLAQDLRHHLADLPIEAHTGTWLQRARKGFRRHKFALAVLLLIVASAVTTTVFWRQAVQRGHIAELARAEAEAAEAEALDSLLRAERVSTFLEDLFKSGDPDAGDLSVNEFLNRGREHLLSELEDDPEIKTLLLGTLGTVYNNLSLYDEARELKEEALRLRLEADPSDHRDLATMTNNLGRLLYDLGDYRSAEQHFRQALAMWQRLGDESRTLIGRRNLAALLTHSGRTDEAMELHQTIVETQRRMFGTRDVEVADSLYSLAVLKRNVGAPLEAETLLRQAHGIFEERLGPSHTKVASALSSLGRVLHEQGRHDEALRCFEDALDLRRELLGPEHVHVANTQKNLAALLLDLEQVDAAGDLLKMALQTLRTKKPDGDWTVADAESLWGVYLSKIGRNAEAESLLLASHQIIRHAKGEQDIATINSRRRVVTMYEMWGRDEEAAAFRRDQTLP